MVGISSGVAVSITYNGITLSKSDRESNSCWIWISPLYQAPIAIHWASLFWSLLSATSSVNPDKVLLSRALESINTLPWWFVTKRLNFVNGIGNITQPCIFIPHCFYQQMARYPKPVKVYRESKTNPVTPTLTLLKWLIECHKNVDTFASYPVEKAQLWVPAVLFFKKRKLYGSFAKGYGEAENGFNILIIDWIKNSKSPLWLTPNYNPVNIIRLGYIRSIWLICTSCNSSIRCRTSRAAPFARSRCNCKEHVCKWYW